MTPEAGLLSNLSSFFSQGYFLLRFLARALGEETYFSFLRKFVHLFHGQLILSQVMCGIPVNSLHTVGRLKHMGIR